MSDWIKTKASLETYQRTKKEKLNEAAKISAKAAEEKRALSDEEQAAVAALVEAGKQAAEQAALLESLVNEEPAEDAPEGDNAPAEEAVSEGRSLRSNVGKRSIAKPDAQKELRDNYVSLLRRGLLGSAAWDNVHTRTVGPIGTDIANGGADALPKSFSDKYVEVLQHVTGVIKAGATVETSSNGQPMDILVVNDTSYTGQATAENDPIGSKDRPVTSKKTLYGHIYDSGIIPVSLQSLQDLHDVEGWLGRALFKRVAKKMNYDFTNGDGSDCATGFLEDATDSGVVTSDYQTVSYSNLVDIRGSLDQEYLDMEDCVWTMHQSTFDVILKLAEGDNLSARLFGSNDISGQIRQTLLGYPIVINNAMPSGANSTAIAFGAFSYYRIRNVGTVELVQFNDAVYRANHQVGMMAFGRTDGVLTDPNAIVYATLGNSGS